MNTIDIVIGIILIIAFFMGFSKGLLRSLASLIGIVVGVYCAMFFSGFVGEYLVAWFNLSEGTTSVVSFIVTFLLIMILFSLLGKILTKVADFAMLGIFNKLLGGAFNVLKFAFLISVVFMFVNASESYRILSEEQRDASVLYAPVAMIAPAILPTLMKEVEEFNDSDYDILNEKSPVETELESEN
ncbi:CvpA family protein [Aequorivita sp. Q41]|uniref:CvpA family protein n=1 Tax=Aequorivita sp. Q41 TaxID=3153300 RepID=UPI003242B009